jgi:hypothetical protein
MTFCDHSGSARSIRLRESMSTFRLVLLTFAILSDLLAPSRASGSGSISPANAGIHASLPLARIKKVMKSDPDVKARQSNIFSGVN